MPAAGSLPFGLALAGGGIKCVAHAGILRGLARTGVAIRAIAATSAASWVAVAYAAGRDLDAFIRRLTSRQARLMAVRARLRPLPARQFEELVAFVLGGDVLLERLAVPVWVPAVNLREGRLEVFREGSAVKACAASAALPGLVQPVAHGGVLYADGGLLNNFPVDVLRDAGIRPVVGVRFPRGGANPTYRSVREQLAVCYGVIASHLDALHGRVPDFTIELPVGDVALLEFRAIPRLLRAGEEAARLFAERYAREESVGPA